MVVWVAEKVRAAGAEEDTWRSGSGEFLSGRFRASLPSRPQIKIVGYPAYFFSRLDQ